MLKNKLLYCFLFVPFVVNLPLQWRALPIARKLMPICKYLLLMMLMLLPTGFVAAQERPDEPVDTTVTASATSSGTGNNAESEATGLALRKAVEEACGTFIRGKTKTEDYKTTYDKVIAHTAGYVLEHKVLKVSVDDDAKTTTVRVQARVSTKKFEEEWARAAHTIAEEGNPRVLVAIAEATQWTASGPAYQIEANGIVQGKLEDFLSDKGLQLMDKATVEGVSKRDVILATVKDNVAEVAAMGAKFKADVVIIGTALAKFAKKLDLGEAQMYQYNCSLTIRAVQADSGRILMSNSYTLSPAETSRHSEDKALIKLANEEAPQVLKDVLNAWRKRANVGKNIELMITGMDRRSWKKFEAEAKEIDGVTAMHLREITESMATIDVEYKLRLDNLADRLEELKDVKVEVVEQNGNRLKMKVVK